MRLIDRLIRRDAGQRAGEGEAGIVSERFYLTGPGRPEREVTRQEWVDAERSAGFCGSGNRSEPSTWSFSGTDGIRGRRALASVPERARRAG